MEIRALGYTVIGSTAIDDWRGFAETLLGMQIAERSPSCVVLRMDDRRQRLAITNEIADGRFVLGWEVADSTALHGLAARLESAGVTVTQGGTGLAARRCVREVITFEDPLGNVVEAFYGAVVDPEPFTPGRPISGFRTGDQGMGHAVLTVANVEHALPFYTRLLGLRLTDYMLKPFKAYFFHLNARHHSLAMIETGKNGLHHLMVETCSLDDVGQGYDLALSERDRVSTTLGRHSNDFMTSFYARTPSPCLMEYGWGGRSIDPEAWQPLEIEYGPSLWGHERQWLPEDKRAAARELRVRAASNARRAPVNVLPGQYIEPK